MSFIEYIISKTKLCAFGIPMLHVCFIMQIESTAGEMKHSWLTFVQTQALIRFKTTNAHLSISEWLTCTKTTTNQQWKQVIRNSTSGHFAEFNLLVKASNKCAFNGWIIRPADAEERWHILNIYKTSGVDIFSKPSEGWVLLLSCELVHSNSSSHWFLKWKKVPEQ